MRHPEYSREYYDRTVEDTKRHAVDKAWAASEQIDKGYLVEAADYVRKLQEIQNTNVRRTIDRLFGQAHKEALRLNSEYDRLARAALQAAEALDTFKRDKLGIGNQRKPSSGSAR